ncbi:TPA: galactose-1-phosphate uridylyltransferase [Candidatus Poribacteria bacterium]|nr:galactose-1-phosphate uridylyltransferase [Candidatus Poribacteria bacterium]
MQKATSRLSGLPQKLQMFKRVAEMSDGRYLIYYSWRNHSQDEIISESLLEPPRLTAFKQKLRALNPEVDATLLEKAYETAETAHRGKLRDQGTPYFEHPLSVVNLLLDELNIHDIEFLSAALLHDVLEDSATTYEQLTELFGGRIARLVQGVTKTDEDTEQYIAKIEQSGEEAVLLKLADRLDNLRSLPLSPNRSKQTRYLSETSQFYLPLARRINAYIYEQMAQLIDQQLQGLTPALRWHPILEEWVIVSPHRQQRTYMPKPEECPLCPGVLEIPEDYEIVAFENRFPSLLRHAPEPVAPLWNSEFLVAAARGICEVVVYTPQHRGSLAEQKVQDIYNLIRVWKNRYEELGAREFIDYVFIFENKGEVIGVTLHHPHGQIYAFPYIPPKIEKELDSSRKYAEKNGRCLFCDILVAEQADGRRIITANDSFVAFIPFFARYPYEIHIYPRAHLRSIAEFSDTIQQDLAAILKIVLLKYDNLFDFSFPYMMIMHQEPTTGDVYDYYHFHIEFYPPHRTKDKIKFLAGCESGIGSFINDAAVEETARELREKPPRE